MAKASRKTKEVKANEPPVNKGEAPAGNTNAEVWTEAEATAFGQQVLTYMEENKNCRSVETACVKCGKYETLFNYLGDKFPVVFEPFKKRAKAIAKSRLIEQGLDSEVNPTMAIFILKNDHDMKDKVEQESKNHNYNHNAEMTKEEMKRIADNLENEV